MLHLSPACSFVFFMLNKSHFDKKKKKNTNQTEEEITIVSSYKKKSGSIV